VTYEACIEYLFAQLPMFHRTGPAAYKPGIGNIIALCELLGHPERDLKFVHIAGTNGKGSTSHLIASALQEAGYTTGLHTSPHLIDFRERIRVNGALIPQEAVVEFVTTYREKWQSIQPSFFELSVAMAFWYFRRVGTDICVIETGLGGRLDSTNIIAPEVCAITTIGLDHMNLLGDTLGQIAFEKAGIIKSGVPVVIGAINGDAREVILNKAVESGAEVIDSTLVRDTPEVPLKGNYQKDNARTAHAVLHTLQSRGWNISPQHVTQGFSQVIANTGLAGRWQEIRQSPKVICDVGHNVDGVGLVVEQVNRMEKAQLHIVLGMVSDKDIGNVLRLLPQDATYYFCKANIPRGMDAVQLREQASVSGLQGEVYPSVAAAYRAALGAAAEQDLVLVTGSFFTVGEVLTEAGVTIG
jgi:dihydrofolate synthase/folylpolyglutamate synthase